MMMMMKVVTVIMVSKGRDGVTDYSDWEAKDDTMDRHDGGRGRSCPWLLPSLSAS